MTCRTARRRMAARFDTTGADVQEHIAGCGRCAAEFEEMVNSVARVAPPRRISASADFKDRTMRRLREGESRQPASRTFPFLRVAFAAGLLLTVVLAIPTRGPVSLLAQSVQAMNGIRSVHIQARMRTPAGDTFENIGAAYPFQPVEMWKEFGATPRWRVENPGRVVVMDGAQSTLFMKNGSRAVRGGVGAGFVESLRPLLDPERVLALELASAQRGELRAAAIRQDGPRITLTSSRKAAGTYGNDWGRNSFLGDADQTRIYQFDAATSRLTGLQIVLHDGGKDVVVFEIVQILYNESLPPELFQLTLPADVVWDVPPEQMSANRPIPSTAREAAVAFFEGMAQRDWERVLTVYPATSIPDDLREYCGGLTVISIGEPFRSGIYAGWYVPYEIRFADGSHKKWMLAVRNDNPAHRWVQDGGI
jgi:hypothetical protein